MPWLLWISILAVFVDATLAFFGDGVFGSTRNVNWACCAKRFPDPISLLGGRPFHKHGKHSWRRYSSAAGANTEDDCHCPMDALFASPHKKKANGQELQWCRDEKDRLRSEKVRDEQRCQSDKNALRKEKARELQRLRDEKGRLHVEMQGQLKQKDAAAQSLQRRCAEEHAKQARELQRCRTEKEQLRVGMQGKIRQQTAEAQAHELQRCKAEREQLRAEKLRLQVQLREKNASMLQTQRRLEDEQAKQDKMDSCRSDFQAAQLASRALQGELKEEKRTRMRMWSRLQAERDSKAALKSEVQVQKMALRRSALELATKLDTEQALSARLQKQLDEAREEATKFGKRPQGDRGVIAKAAWTVVAILATALGLWLLKLMSKLSDEQLASLEQDLGMVTDEAEPGADANSGHVCLTSWEEHGEEKVRCIKVHCPGAEPDDITVDVLFNGCVVTIAGHGEASQTWTKRIQFRLSEGLFEFSEEQAKIEDGWLTLVFRPYVSHGRVFRFPRPFGADSSREAASSPKLSSSAESWVERALAKPSEGLPEYYHLASHAGEGSSAEEEHDDEFKGAEEVPSSPKLDGPSDLASGLDASEPADAPVVLAEEEGEEELTETERDGEEEEEGEEELMETERDGEEEEEGEEELMETERDGEEDMPELLVATEPSEPAEKSEVAQPLPEPPFGAADEGSVAVAGGDAPKSAATSEDFEKVSAAVAGSEAPESPATSEGFEKVDTGSSIGDDQAPGSVAEADGSVPQVETPEPAPPTDEVVVGSQPASEGYDEVLEVGHESEDASDFELL